MTRVVLWGLVGNSVSNARVIIAIDGPAGAGKSTIAKALAHAMNLQYLDTGAMFRAVTSTVLRLGIDPSDIEQVGALCEILSMEVLENQVIADGVDVTVDIRTPAVTKAASVIATNPLVRANLRSRQRAWTSERGGGVVEGRDIGSVVFPDATLKVYLTATPRVRAGRRVAEIGGDVDEVERLISERDLLDSTRADSPLREAEGSVLIDTSGRHVVDIVQQIVSLVEGRLS